MAKDINELTREQVYAEEDALIDFQFALIDAMKERDMNKAALAAALGVTRARVSQLFSPEANPTIKLAARALLAVGLKNKYCPITEGADEADVTWLGKVVEVAVVEELSVEDTTRWFACQRRCESRTTWNRETRRVANSNGRRAMEAA
ncbi:helix-turn-helix transcriptional regulator [Rhizobium sp. S152]|uniref:helix-turn-helix domain-containing protein n=1 Tax=Rhizobium sp. S152 TaxID=3055038 RepID=UPI0025A9869D|nr:helix-turn-helix transcriptional regulator [Rhizobium sp. S152]MDM9627095.1 helix-turn-helix transcriptional regulator [Rhizobium sp. S152]